MYPSWLEWLRSPAVLVTAGLQIIAAAVLCGVPLFDTLGFERAFVAGLIATFTAPAVAIAFIRRARRERQRHPVRVAGRALIVNLAALLPHLIAGWLVEATTQPCDPQEGLLFLVLCAGGNAAFGTALGSAAGLLTERRTVPAIVTIVTLAGFLMAALYRLYAEPQIFVYSVPFGFWPGSLYDEALGVSTTLWAFRGYSLLFAATILAAVTAVTDGDGLLLTVRPRVTSTIAAVSLSLGTYGAYQAGGSLGFAFDRSSVIEGLSRKIETEHFEIYVDPRIRPRQAEQLSWDHELRYAQMKDFFGGAPEGKIRSFVYHDVHQKARLMGAARTQIARPWAKEIHIHGFDHPHRVLKHELAHIFAAQWAEGPFAVPATAGIFVNIGVVEGVAVAADWPIRELTVHGWTKAMWALKLAPNLRTTLSPTGFWAVSSSRAYTVAGSFLRYLADEHGKEKLAELYRTNDFHGAYGRSLDALVSEWETFIEGLPLPEEDLVIAEHRFKRPSIFQKVCAHQAANLAQRGYGRLASGDLEGGRQDLEVLFSYAPQDPSPLIALAQAFGRAEDFESSQGYIYRASAIKNTTRKASMQVVEAQAALAWRSTDDKTARAGFDEVRAAHLSTPSDRLQQARLMALDQDAPVQDVLRPLLLGDLRFELGLVRLGKLATQHPQDTLIHYLYGRALAQAEAYPESVASLRLAYSHPFSDTALRFENGLALGRSLVANRQLADAQTLFETLGQSTVRPAYRAEAEDWANRAAFLRARTSTTSAALE